MTEINNTALFSDRINYLDGLKKTENKILRYFPDTDLRCGHKGLADLAKKAGIDPIELKNGQMLLFVNRSRNAIKIYAPGNTIVHQKTPYGNPLNPKAFVLIPKFFNGQTIDLKGALGAAILKDFRLTQH